MSIGKLDLRNNFELESLDIIPNEAEHEIQFPMQGTIQNLDEATLSAITGKQCKLETVTIRIVD